VKKPDLSVPLDGIWSRTTLLLANDAPATWPQAPHHVTRAYDAPSRTLAAAAALRSGRADAVAAHQPASS